MYRLIGFNPSPYSIKMRAVLRYRRLPFIWDNRTDAREVAQRHGLPPVIPVLAMTDGVVMNDSTPLIHELERRHPHLPVTIDEAMLHCHHVGVGNTVCRPFADDLAGFLRVGQVWQPLQPDPLARFRMATVFLK